MALHVETIRKQLMTRREALAADLKSMTTQLLNEDASYTDAVDQAAAETDKSLTLQMKDRDRNLLTQIDEAINRIENGSFGDCEKCGENISEGRIKVFPFTTFCIECKAEIESEEHRFPSRA